MSTHILNIPAAGAAAVPVFGISEWQNYYRGDEPGIGAPEIIDRCVEAHAAVGVDSIVWNAGRGTILYHSDLPHTTVQYELGFVPKPERVSCEYVRRVMSACCPLRRAIALGQERGMPILGRLSMNRHYGTPANIDSNSRFRRGHPEWVERGKLGEPIGNRMCYAVPEVRQERLDILLEIQRIGVDALVLDFCRQMPIIWYHKAVIQPYIEKTGIDPRTIDTAEPADYASWFQFRADVLTGFMRSLRSKVRAQEHELDRPCPIIARVPDYTEWLMIACSLDIETWFREDLIDATMLSPFPRLRDDLKSYPGYHVQVAHRYDKPCIGGVGSNGMKERRDVLPDPEAAVAYGCRVAHDQYRAGVDAMSLYQSEALCRKDYLRKMIANLGQKEWIATVAEKVPEPPRDDPRYFIGKDWHCGPRNEGLGTAVCGNLAL